MQASVEAARAQAICSGASPTERVRAFYAQRAVAADVVDALLAEYSGDEGALLGAIAAEHGADALAETDALARGAARRAAADADRGVRRRATPVTEAPRLLSPPEPPRDRAPAPSPSSRRTRRRMGAPGGVQSAAPGGAAPRPVDAAGGGFGWDDSGLSNDWRRDRWRSN